MFEEEITGIGWRYLSWETHLQGQRSKYLTASVHEHNGQRGRKQRVGPTGACSLTACLALPAILPSFLCLFLGACLFLPDSASKALTQSAPSRLLLFPTKLSTQRLEIPSCIQTLMSSYFPPSRCSGSPLLCLAPGQLTLTLMPL